MVGWVGFVCGNGKAGSPPSPRLSVGRIQLCGAFEAGSHNRECFALWSIYLQFRTTTNARRLRRRLCICKHTYDYREQRRESHVHGICSSTWKSGRHAMALNAIWFGFMRNIFLGISFNCQIHSCEVFQTYDQRFSVKKTLFHHKNIVNLLE